MEDELSRFFKFQWSKNKFLSVVIILLIIAMIVVPGIFLQPHVEEATCLKTAWDIYVNLIASLLAFLFAIAIIYLISRIFRRHEDELKVSYRNSKMHTIYKDKGEDKDKWHPYKKSFPLHSGDKYECEVYCNELFFHEDGESDFRIIDIPDKYFKVTHFIDIHADKLLAAHAGSKTTNEFTPRLEDFAKASTKNGNINTLTISRSTYVNHLLTNRAMDYEIGKDVSLRRMYESIDVLTDLPLSKMSNHIGINALVFLTGETGRDYLILPRRGKDATVVKNGITASIASRLMIDDNYTEAIKNGAESAEEYIREGCIKNAFERALLLTENGVKKVQSKATIHFLGLARDPYEGGKPTFFYYVDLNLTREKFWKLTQDNYKAEGIDAIKELMIVDWKNIHLTDVYPKREEADRYDDEKLQLTGAYRHSKFVWWHPGKKEFQSRSWQKDKFIFEQNLIVNFWFYLKHKGEIEDEKA